MAAREARVITIMVFLVVGAIANIAVAWVCAAWGPVVGSRGPASLSQQSVANVLTERQCEWRVHSRIGYDEFYAGPLLNPPPETESETRTFDFSLPYVPWDPPTAVLAGWPCRSLWSDVRVDAAHPQAWLIGGIALPARFPASSGVDTRRLALMPIALGFAINTAIYAAVLWMLLPGWRAFRRWRRQRLALCVRCAYPVGASDVCTECGARAKVGSQRVG